MVAIGDMADTLFLSIFVVSFPGRHICPPSVLAKGPEQLRGERKGEKSFFNSFWAFYEFLLKNRVLRLVLNLRTLESPQIIKRFFRIRPYSIPNQAVSNCST
jgi:hypothetical protein